MSKALALRALSALRLHPDAERVPLADHADLTTLRASLAEHGQQDPIDITADDMILDGRTRWTLLGDLGAQTIQVRVVDVPEAQQTDYIVDRALARRHLNAEQKRALNALLREQVVEIAPDASGTTVQIGRGQSQRAETLGVTRDTVRRWDEEGGPALNKAGPPTHYRQTSGRVQPLHPIKQSGPVVAPIDFPRTPGIRGLPGPSAALLEALRAVTQLGGTVNQVLYDATPSQHNRLRAEARRVARVVRSIDVDMATFEGEANAQ